MSDGNAIWICFRCFLCCLWLCSFAAEEAGAKNGYIESAKSTCIKGACAKSSCIRGAGAVKHLRIHLLSF